MTIQERAEIAAALDLPKAMTPEQVAAFTGSHPKSIYNAIDKGNLKAIKIAGNLRILSIDLINYRDIKKKQGR